MKKISWFAAAVFAVLCFGSNVYAQISATERAALIALYNSTDGANWTNNAGWLGAEGSECTWYGISCNIGEGNISGLYLNNNNLKNTLPSELGNLSGIQHIILYGNQLQIGTFPVWIENLSNLVRLDLSESGVTGNIPDWLGNLSDLSWIFFGGNELTGPIPSSIGNLTELEHLVLWGNQLTGNIPSSLQNLLKILQIDLASNQLTGNIPLWFKNFSKLYRLNLGDNQLNGIIPPELGSIISLQELILYSNQLTGSIPPEIGNLVNLQRLFLFDNQLSGSIPPELGNLVSLQYLQLWTNQLSGSIPPELGNLINLIGLGLSGNQLSGYIPAQIGTLVNLWGLWLGDNQLSGSIPPEIGNLVNLTELSLSYNQLSGSIPSELGKLTNLVKLILMENQLTGVIPVSLSALSNLQILSLGSNLLSGTIPPELGNLVSLQGLVLSSNQLSGSIPPEIGKLVNLEFLILSTNQLSGSIPTEIGNLSNLIQLNLKSNQLTGSIPVQIGNLSNLQTLWLGDNQLSGAVPSELMNLLNLMQITLCNNALSLNESLALFLATRTDIATTDTSCLTLLPCDVTAAFTPSARVVKTGDTVTFTNTSEGGGGCLYSGECPDQAVFDWDFDGDGTPEITSAGMTQKTHSYAAPGEYTVILTAHGANGCITTYQMIIYVNDPACAGILEAAIAMSPASVEMGQAVSFTGTATGTGTPSSWSWDINGDSTEDYAVQNPSHTYPEIGTYSAILTVSNGTCTAFAEKTVTVNCDVTAAFSLSSASVTAGTSVTFTNTSTGTGAAGATYEWDFDGNLFTFNPDLTTTGLSNPPARVYSTVGTFTVIMKVTPISGCTSFVQKTVTVTEAYVPPYYPVEDYPVVEDTSPELKASVSGREVILSWTEISGAGGYKLLYAPYPDGTPVSEGDLGLVNSLRGPLPPGSAYYAAVIPYNGTEGWGEISNVIYFEIPLTFPGAPKLTVDTSGDTVYASWTGVQNATGYILYYAPYPAMEPIGYADMGMQTSLSGPLPAGSAFYVAVQAYDQNGAGELSNIEYFVIPAIPESPVLTVGMNGNAVNLSWTSVNGAEGYKLIYSPFPTGEPEGVADVGNQTFIPSFTLPAGSMYYVAVQGYNSGGESQMSNREVITVPALLSAPGLFVNKTGRTVSLSWTSVMNADGYTLYYLNALGKKIGELDMKKQRELSLTLPANSKFHVAVQAYNAEGKSGFSNVEYFEILY